MPRMDASPPSDPPAGPAAQGLLPLDGGHAMAWQAWGPARAPAVLVLHGGPGSGTSPALLAPFDLRRVRVVSYDQRGCGRSLPQGALQDNDIPHLLRDAETLREHLGIARWQLVAGGSWGATLALLLASHAPRRVASVLLRNCFVPTPAELHWFFEGARSLDPTAWERLARAAGGPAPGGLCAALGRVMQASPPALQAEAARAWQAWERRVAGLPAAPDAQGAALQALLLRYRVQSHVLAGCCALAPGALAEAARGLSGRRAVFVHGAEDRVCRPQAAHALHRQAAGSRWVPVAGAGHDPFHPALADAMRQAADGLLAATESACAP